MITCHLLFPFLSFFFSFFFPFHIILLLSYPLLISVLYCLSFYQSSYLFLSGLSLFFTYIPPIFSYPVCLFSLHTFFLSFPIRSVSFLYIHSSYPCLTFIFSNPFLTVSFIVSYPFLSIQSLYYRSHPFLSKVFIFPILSCPFCLYSFPSFPGELVFILSYPFLSIRYSYSYSYPFLTFQPSCAHFPILSLFLPFVSFYLSLITTFLPSFVSSTLIPIHHSFKSFLSNSHSTKPIFIKL